MVDEEVSQEEFVNSGVDVLLIIEVVFVCGEEDTGRCEGVELVVFVKLCQDVVDRDVVEKPTVDLDVVEVAVLLATVGTVVLLNVLFWEATGVTVLEALPEVDVVVDELTTTVPLVVDATAVGVVKMEDETVDETAEESKADEEVFRFSVGELLVANRLVELFEKDANGVVKVDEVDGNEVPVVVDELSGIVTICTIRMVKVRVVS